MAYLTPILAYVPLNNLVIIHLLLLDDNPAALRRLNRFDSAFSSGFSSAVSTR
jgi:hypothetical protein